MKHRLPFRALSALPFRSLPVLLPLLSGLAACETIGLDPPFGRPSSRLDHPFAVASRRILEGGSAPGRRAGGEDARVFLTGVEFPASYDWERDTAYGTVACRLVLFSGTERILSIDAGPAFEVSPDPDMHRVAEGHLYTDYSTDTETVIRRDGVELFRFPGRESVRGFLLAGGHVHTLGEDRNGDGFVYRVDAEVVLASEEGVLLPGGEAPAGSGKAVSADGRTGSGIVQNGPLYLEDGEVCFSFYVPGTPPSLFLVRSGVAEPVVTDPTTVEILDQRLYEGVLYRLEKRSRVYGRPCFVAGDGSTALSGEPRLSPDACKCRLVPCGGEMFVRGWYRYPDGTEEFHLWNRSGILYQDTRPIRAFSVLPLSGSGLMAYVMDLPSGILIGKGEAIWNPIGRYRLYTPSCATLCASPGAYGKYYVALSGPSCILWTDGLITPIPLYGYLSGIWIE